MAITWHLIATETSNLVHILVYEKLQQIWPRPRLLTLALKSFPKVKIFETYELRKTVKGEGESQPKFQIKNVKVKSQVKVEQKIKFTYLAITWHLIVTETSNLVHILVYENLHQIWPWPWPLTLTLKSSPKVKLFETYQLRKTSQNMLGYYAQGIIYCCRGQRLRSTLSKRSNSLNYL